MTIIHRLALCGLAGAALALPAQAQTTLTMSSWVPPSHPLTKNFLQGWANEAEKVGLEIINATPGSSLDMFPFKSLEEVCLTISPLVLL